MGLVYLQGPIYFDCQGPSPYNKSVGHIIYKAQHIILDTFFWIINKFLLTKEQKLQTKRRYKNYKLETIILVCSTANTSQKTEGVELRKNNLIAYF